MPLIAGSTATSSSIRSTSGPSSQHRDRDHLDAHRLGDREVPVIAGDRAQELDARLVLPGPRRVHAAVQQREDDDVVHQLQAGVVARDQVGHRDAEQLAEDGPQFGQAVQAAVVAGVGALAVAVSRHRAGSAARWTGRAAPATACRGSDPRRASWPAAPRNSAGCVRAVRLSSSGPRESNDTMLARGPFRRRTPRVDTGCMAEVNRGPRAPDRAH